LEADLSERVKAEDRRVGELAINLAKEQGNANAWANDLPRWYKSLDNTRYRIVSTAFSPVANKIAEYEEKHNAKPTIDMVERWIYTSLSSLPEQYQKAIQHGVFFDKFPVPQPVREEARQTDLPYDRTRFYVGRSPSSEELNKNIVFDYLKTSGIY